MGSMLIAMAIGSIIGYNTITIGTVSINVPKNNSNKIIISFINIGSSVIEKMYSDNCCGNFINVRYLANAWAEETIKKIVTDAELRLDQISKANI